MEAQDRVRLEMVNVGAYQNRVLQVLSKVKGLSQAPEALVSSTPCIIADDIPKEMAEKLQGFLEKAGAEMRSSSMNEPEEDLFSPDDLPLSDDFSASDQSASDVPEFTPDDWALGASASDGSQNDADDAGGPSDEFGGFSAVDTSSMADENTEDELFGENAAMDGDEIMADFEPEEQPKKKMSFPSLPKFGKKGSTPKAAEDDEEETVKEKKKPAFSSLLKKKPRSEAEEAEDAADETSGASKKLAANPMLMLLVGVLAGAILFGVGGWWIGKSSAPDVPPVDATALQDAQNQNAQLQAAVDQRAQEIQTLTQEKAALQQELDALKTQTANAQASAPSPQSIEPSQTPNIGQTPEQQALIASFKSLSEQHASILENSYDAQKQAACSKQILLDGNGETGYAQVVRKFSAKFTSFDILENNSLLTPYIAELKMPFQMEIRTGKSEQACQAAQLKPADTSSHPEFGTFYGVWTIQYAYRDGKWSVKSAVIEKNRALVAKAYKIGSPDSAKLPLDFSLYPGLKN
ncbi:hypothetical protein U14_01278 [Candidatus Moduliflexus flocculans]|uniref:Uncharacterized protein n=1 Tax=Candidatus Moduliflexus flocculans TaxID=1499966 RepID=A0A0S6VRU2_9BACT|nr:hypothetical protein U14_01278 [Candidatus Moduliflexus flocculans]